MAFLKQLRADIVESARSLAVMKMEKHLESWEEESPDEQKGMKGYIGTIRKELARLRARLRKLGDATKVTVYGLPVKGGKDNPKRANDWMIAQRDWESSMEIPLKRSVTERDFGYEAQSDLNVKNRSDEKPTLFDLWFFNRNVYLAMDTDLSAGDVRALLNQDKNKRRLALEKAHALQAMTEQLDKPRQRERVPQEVRIEVWQRDSGRCVECGNQEALEFDHIIPFGMGGSNTARNLQLLCGDCNRRKGMTLG